MTSMRMFIASRWHSCSTSGLQQGRDDCRHWAHTTLIASLSTEYARIGPQFASIYCIPNNVEALSTRGTLGPPGRHWRRSPKQSQLPTPTSALGMEHGYSRRGTATKYQPQKNFWSAWAAQYRTFYPFFCVVFSTASECHCGQRLCKCLPSMSKLLLKFSYSCIHKDARHAVAKTSSSPRLQSMLHRRAPEQCSAHPLTRSSGWSRWSSPRASSRSQCVARGTQRARCA
jgi:hypothetical protein